MKTSVLRRSGGFTLVELMVTILGGAILASIAIPAYTNQIRRSRRTEARTAVLDMAAREEKYFATHNVYSIKPTDVGYAAAFPQPVGTNYQISVACRGAADPTTATNCPNGFIATANPINAQVKDTQCSNFIVDDTGKQTVSGSSSLDAKNPCWN